MLMLDSEDQKFFSLLSQVTSTLIVGFNLINYTKSLIMNNIFKVCISRLSARIIESSFATH